MASRSNPFWEPSTVIGIRRRDSAWADGSEEPVSANRPFLGRPLSAKQVLAVVVLVLASLASLVGRAFELQVFQGAYHRGLAEGNSVRSEIIPAPRGLLYDQYGRALTENIPIMSLALVPYEVPRDDADRQQSFATVSALTNIPAETFAAAWKNLSEARRQTVDPVLIDAPITPEARLRFQLSNSPHPGLSMVTTAERKIVSIDSTNTSLAHIVGYVGRVSTGDLALPGGQYTTTDVIGKNGLELTYENILKGVNGHRDVEVNALGKPQGAEVITPPVSGKHVWLTIDTDLEAAATASLKTALARAHVRRGGLIVMNPDTGAVLAIVSLPTFDANEFNHGLSAADYARLSNDADHPLFDRIVQGLYPSGSTIKPVYAVAALAEGVISPVTTVMSVGGIHVGPWFFPDWKAGGHGLTNVKKALADSVNTFFYTICGGYGNIAGLGIDRMAAWAAKFGLGQKTGIDLPDEATGLVPTPDWKLKTKKEAWYIGDTYHVAIGQGDLTVTPLQVATFTNALANGGTLVTPHLMSEVVSVDGRSRQKVYVSIIRDHLAPPNDIEVVRQGMRQTVTQGSARSLGDLPFPVAGKTGTAQNTQGNPHAWFTGFGPYDHPQLTVTVMLENAGEGSTYAVPVAHDIFSWWANNRTER